MAQCATTAWGGAVPRPCVRRARGRFGGLGPVPGVVSLPFPPSHPACPALRVAGRPALGVTHPRSLVRHSTRSVRSASSVRLPFW